MIHLDRIHNAAAILARDRNSLVTDGRTLLGREKLEVWTVSVAHAGMRNPVNVSHSSLRVVFRELKRQLREQPCRKNSTRRRCRTSA